MPVAGCRGCCKTGRNLWLFEDFPFHSTFLPSRLFSFLPFTRFELHLLLLAPAPAVSRAVLLSLLVTAGCRCLLGYAVILLLAREADWLTSLSDRHSVMVA